MMDRSFIFSSVTESCAEVEQLLNQGTVMVFTKIMVLPPEIMKNNYKQCMEIKMPKTGMIA